MGKFLDEKAGLEYLEGDLELYKILLDEYAAENSFNRTELEALVEKGSLEAAAKYIHRLKGSSLQIGAKSAGEKAALLEGLFRGKKSCDKNTLKNLVSEFDEVYRNTLKEIRGFTANLR